MTDREKKQAKKIEKITKVWERHLKGNPDTHPTWQLTPKSFIRWSLHRYKDGYELTIVNKEFPHILKPYNIKWAAPSDNDVLLKTGKKRGRKSLSEETINKVRELLASGITKAKIAEIVGISASSVSKISKND